MYTSSGRGRLKINMLSFCLRTHAAAPHVHIVWASAPVSVRHIAAAALVSTRGHMDFEFEANKST